MRPLLTLLALLMLGPAGQAAEIRIGAAMQVRGNSMWFQDEAKFAEWLAVKRRGDAAAVASFERTVRRERDAWQFFSPVTVKILKNEPEKNRVEVEMTTEGRLQGTQWFIDPDAVEK